MNFFWTELVQNVYVVHNQKSTAILVSLFLFLLKIIFIKFLLIILMFS